MDIKKILHKEVVIKEDYYSLQNSFVTLKGKGDEFQTSKGRVELTFTKAFKRLSLKTYSEDGEKVICKSFFTELVDIAIHSSWMRIKVYQHQKKRKKDLVYNIVIMRR